MGGGAESVGVPCLGQRWQIVPPSSYIFQGADGEGRGGGLLVGCCFVFEFVFVCFCFLPRGGDLKPPNGGCFPMRSD